MRAWRVGIFFLSGVALLGCSSMHRNAATRPTTRPFASTRPISPEALLTLDQIQPPVALATSTSPATRPAWAPAEALGLYARARNAMLDNRRYTAISMLEKAIVLDPTSFDLRYALGRAHLGSAGDNLKAIDAFEQAAALKPENLDVRLQLGRLYLTRGDATKALNHLRIAVLTDNYRTADDSSAVTDLLLARALQQTGYDRAALDQYDSLLTRLRHATNSIRSNPELVYLINRPEVLLLQIGQLHEHLNQYEDALQVYQSALEHEPGNFDSETHVTQTLALLGRYDEAATQAAEAVVRFRASYDSLALLRDVYRKIGREGSMPDELYKLYQKNTEQRYLLFAVVDLLKEEGQQTKAQDLLSRAAVDGKYDLEVVRRLFKLYTDSPDTQKPAILLIEAMAAHPDSMREISNLWAELLRPSRKNHLRLADLQKLQVSPGAEAARLFWVARVADAWGRDSVAKAALEQATRITPLFAPAYRMRLNNAWLRADWEDARKIEISQQLSEQARVQGNTALADELTGLSLLNQKKADKAAEAFDRAMKQGDPSADLRFAYALALREVGQVSRFEQVLLKLAADYPSYEDSYRELFNYYLSQRSGPQALKVLQTWLIADPGSVSARLLQAQVVRSARPEQAEAAVNQLMEENADDVDVLNEAQSIYSDTGRLDQFIKKLEDQRVKNPQNRTAVERLVSIYAKQNRVADASRVLDATRVAVGNDPDLLYYVAHQYASIDQKQLSEDIMQEIVKIDPTHVGASNDLGYSWTEDGKNLAQAESLIRVAIEAEPDNESFLDSMGWVLYKRGKFDEADKYFQEALKDAVHPDPVILDHHGDVLYQLGRHDEAHKEWLRASTRLAAVGTEQRDELKQLKVTLQDKLKQAETGQPVKVAPVLEIPAKGVQAKN